MRKGKNTLITDPIERALLDQVQAVSMTLQQQALQVISHPIAALSTIFYVVTGAIAYGRLRDLAEICCKFIDDEIPEYRSEMHLKMGGSLAAYRNTQTYIDNANAQPPAGSPVTPAPDIQTAQPAAQPIEFDMLWPTELEDSYD